MSEKRDGVMAENHKPEVVKKVCISRIIPGWKLREAIRLDYLQTTKNEMIASLVEYLIKKGYPQIKTEVCDYGVHIECKILVTHPDKITKGAEQ